jgi:hypothetical protein
MAAATTQSGVRGTGLSPDVGGGIVAAVLGLLHLFVLNVGGAVGILVLFVGWPLIGGTVAARLSPVGDERVAGVVAGVLGAIFATIVVFLAGIAGLWSSLITTTFGVALWPVTLGLLLMLLLTWSVFGLAGAELSVRVNDVSD